MSAYLHQNKVVSCIVQTIGHSESTVMWANQALPCLAQLLLLCQCASQLLLFYMQEGQHVIGDAYDNVVIMFSDIVGFSTMSSSMSAVEVFLMLTNLYYAFDRLVDKYGVYKVETIGDGYMIAAGQ